jgi:hypothetical protein
LSTNILTDDDEDEGGESRCSGRARIGGLRPSIKYVLQFDKCSLLIVHPATLFGYACLVECFRYMFDTWDDQG